MSSEDDIKNIPIIIKRENEDSDAPQSGAHHQLEPSPSASDTCSMNNKIKREEIESAKVQPSGNTGLVSCPQQDDSDETSAGSEAESDDDNQSTGNDDDDQDCATVDEESTEEEDDDDDDQYDDCDEDEEPIDTKPKDLSGYLSSDDESEKCVICLSRFLGQTVGTPEVCNHNFCLECIEEWSKQVSACPVDRLIYSAILARREINGPVIQKINVSASSQIRPTYDDVAPDDVTYCEVCGRCDREDRLLLCDGCDFGFHLECLNPPLEHVPIEDWYCPDCNRVNINTTPQNTNLLNVIAHGISSEYSLIQRYRRRRMNPQGISEVVRTRINERRRTRGNDDLLSSSMSNSASSRVVYSAYSDRASSTAPDIRRKDRQTKSTRKTIKRKTTKRKKTAKRKAKTTRRKGSRRVKRKRKVSRRATAISDTDSIRKRLARKLGLTNVKKSPFGLPVFKKAQSKSSCLNKSKDDLITQRKNAGITQLSLCGAEPTHHHPVADPQLHVIHHTNQNDDEEFEHDVGSGAAAIAAIVRRRMTPACAARILAKKASTLRVPTSNRLPSSSIQRNETIKNQGGTFDLLGSILSSQTILLSKSDQTYISREGDLRVRPQPLRGSPLALNHQTQILVRTHNDNQQVKNTEKSNSTNVVSDASSQSVSNSNTASNSNHENQPSGDKPPPEFSNVDVSSSMHHQGCTVSSNDDRKTSSPEDNVIKRPSPKKIIKNLEVIVEKALDLSHTTCSVETPSKVSKGTEREGDCATETVQAGPVTHSIAMNQEERKLSKPESKSALRASNDLRKEEGAANESSKDNNDQQHGNSRIEVTPKENLTEQSEDSSSEPKLFSSNLQDPKSTSIEPVPQDMEGQTLGVKPPRSTSLPQTNGDSISREPPQIQSQDTNLKVKRCKHGKIIVTNKEKAKKRDTSDVSESIAKENHTDVVANSKKKREDSSKRNHSSTIDGVDSKIEDDVGRKNFHSKDGSLDSSENKASRDKSVPKDVVYRSDQQSKSKRDKKRKRHRRSCSRGRDRYPSKNVSRSRSRSRTRSRSRNKALGSGLHESRSGTRKSHHRGRSRDRSPRASRRHRHRSRSRSSSRSRHRDGDRKTKKDYSQNEEYYSKNKRSVKKSPVFDNDTSRKSEYRREDDRSYYRHPDMPSTSHRYSPFDEDDRRSYRNTKISRTRSIDGKNATFVDELDHDKAQPSSYKKHLKASSLNKYGIDVETSYDSHKSRKEPLKDSADVSIRHVSVHSKSREGPAAHKTELELKTQKNPESSTKLSLVEPFTISKRRILEPFDSVAKDHSSARRELYDAPDGEYENAPAKSVAQDYMSRFLPKLGEISCLSMDPTREETLKDSDSSALFNQPIETGLVKNSNLQPFSPSNKRAESVQSLPTPIQDELNSGDMQRKYRSPERNTTRHDMSSPDSSMKSNSDIYDPEAPLGPISPSDSPPVSPLSQAATKNPTSSLGALETSGLVEHLRKMRGVRDGGDKSMVDTMANLLNSLAETNPNLLDTINKLTGTAMPNDESTSRRGTTSLMNKLSNQSASSQRVGVAKPQSPSTPPRQHDHQEFRTDDGVPSSAVDLNNKEKYIQKLNRQERVIEEVKLALKPHYQRRAVTKEEYKDILRRAVPKICHSKNGEINAVKIRHMVEAYIKKAKHARKKHT